MPRQLRHFEPGSLIEVTTRTIHGRLLMRPSPAFNDIFLGTMGYAQERYGLELHGFAALSNHYHLHCSPEHPEQLSAFMRMFNSKLAREIGRLHDWREKVWNRRFLPILISEEPEAQIGRLLYLLRHGVKEGLVASPRDWPGPNCVETLLSGKPLVGHWFNRTLEYEANRRGLEFGLLDFASAHEVELSPLPCFRHLSLEEYRRRMAEMVAEVEEEARLRRMETGREPRGVTFVLRQQPHERPMRSKCSPAPACHAASKRVRKALKEAYRLFVAAYRRAAERLRGGEFEVRFPDYCFPPPRPFVRGSPATASSWP